VSLDLALQGSARSSGTETDNNGQSSIDLTKLAEREQPVGFAEPARIDSPELLDHDPRPLAVNFHLGPERSRVGAC